MVLLSFDIYYLIISGIQYSVTVAFTTESGSDLCSFEIPVDRCLNNIQKLIKNEIFDFGNQTDMCGKELVLALEDESGLQSVVGYIKWRFNITIGDKIETPPPETDDNMEQPSETTTNTISTGPKKVKRRKTKLKDIVELITSKSNDEALSKLKVWNFIM